MRMNKTINTNHVPPKTTTPATIKNDDSAPSGGKQTAVQIHEGAHLLNNHNKQNNS